MRSRRHLHSSAREKGKEQSSSFTGRHTCTGWSAQIILTNCDLPRQPYCCCLPYIINFRYCCVGLYCVGLLVIIRLEARLRPNIGFSFERAGTVFTRYDSAESEPIWMKSGALWVHCQGLALADFGRDPRSSERWRGKRIFCQINNARLYRFAVGQISRNLNTTRRSVSRWILLE